MGQRLDLARVRDEEPGVREDQLRRQRDHRRLDRHRDHDAEVADGAVQAVQERDDDLVDEGEHADLGLVDGVRRRAEDSRLSSRRDRPEGPHFTPPPTDRPIVLTGADLTIADVEAVARHGRAAVARRPRRATGCRRRATSSSASSPQGAVVYGVTTGFGALATTFIAPGATPSGSRRTS